MNEALEIVRKEIKKTEEHLERLKAAEKALMLVDVFEGSESYEIADPAPPAKGLAGAIRGFLKEKGPMTKADLDKALSDEKWSLPKAGISGALQAMRVKGVVARSKAGKWTIK